MYIYFFIYLIYFLATKELIYAQVQSIIALQPKSIINHKFNPPSCPNFNKKVVVIQT